MKANSLIRKGVYISYPCPDVSSKVYKKALTYNIVDCGRIRACQEVGEEIHHHNSILFGLEGERKNISDKDKCLDKTSNAAAQDDGRRQQLTGAGLKNRTIV